MAFFATAPSPAAAKVFLTQEEALKLAFPGAVIQRRTAFLTAAESKDVASLSGGDRKSTRLNSSH